MLYIGEVTKIATDLSILIALEHQVSLRSRLDPRKGGVQFRGLLDNLAFFPHQVGEINIDKLNSMTVIWVSGQALPREYIASTPKIHDDFLLRRRTLKEPTGGHINDVHPQVIASIDEWSPALKLLNKEAEEVRLVRIVYTFYTPFGNDATAISLFI